MEEQPTNEVSKMRISRLESDLNDACKQIDDLEKEINILKVDYARMSERLAIYQLLQAGFATIAAIVAATIAKVIP